MTTLTVCETCGYDPDAPNAERPGAILARLVEQQLAEAPVADLRLRRIRCLMACKRHCSVLLQAPGKLGYVLGDFHSDDAAASTLLEWVRHYQASASGQVAWRDWPEGIKGKFIARIPVLDD